MYKQPDEVCDIGGERRIRVAKRGFFSHIRPRSYQPEAIAFSNTYYLGFLCVFFLILECVTGALLMIYYAPTPAEAYSSIILLETEVPFGSLMRELHRLGGECMVAVVILHMLRVFVTDTYGKQYTYTWLTGVGLLLCTLFLAFSGYLLPWDQLAFWAVTIGTSMAEEIPIIGETLTHILRGGAEFGQNGLLRFYLLHIIALPAVLFMLLGVHYYRVARVNSLSLPPGKTAGKRKVPFYPQIFIVEINLSLGLLLLLAAISYFVYQAPLESHADPVHTPLHTQAPWFFLWLQGTLKLGNTMLFGICLPIALLVFLLVLPCFATKKRRHILKRPVHLTLTLLFIVYLAVSSFLGTGKYGVDIHPAAALAQDFLPEEMGGPLQNLSFGELPQGVYQSSNGKDYSSLEPEFRVLLQHLFHGTAALVTEQNFVSAESVLIIEDWQERIKRISLRIHFQKSEDDEMMTEEALSYVYNRGPVIVSSAEEHTVENSNE